MASSLHIPAERTDVGDGLWTSRVSPSPSALRAATSPAGERQERSNAGIAARLGSPFGGAVTEGD